jgi:hypothetical protein
LVYVGNTLDLGINKLVKMSKRYYNRKKKMATQMTDDQIKTVMDTYKPNFIQKLFMKYFSPIETTNIIRNTTIAVVIGLIAVGAIFSSIAEVIVGSTIGLVTITGEIYEAITNRKRIIQLVSVLNMTPDEIRVLESKYYLA